MDFMKTLEIAARIQQSKEKELVKKKSTTSHNNRNILQDGRRNTNTGNNNKKSDSSSSKPSSVNKKSSRAPPAASDRCLSSSSSVKEGVKDSAVRVFLQKKKEEQLKKQADEKRQKKELLAKRAVSNSKQRTKKNSDALQDKGKSNKFADYVQKQVQQGTGPSRKNKPPGGAIEKLKIREKHEISMRLKEQARKEDSERRRKKEELKRSKEKHERKEMEKRKIQDRHKNKMKTDRTGASSISSYEKLLKLAATNNDISVTDHAQLAQKLITNRREQETSSRSDRDDRRREQSRKLLKSEEKSKPKVPYSSKNNVKPIDRVSSARNSSAVSKGKLSSESQSNKNRNSCPPLPSVSKKLEQILRNKSQQNHQQKMSNSESSGKVRSIRPDSLKDKNQKSQSSQQPKPKTFSIVSETTYEEDLGGSKSRGRPPRDGGVRRRDPPPGVGKQIPSLPPGLVRCNRTQNGGDSEDSEEADSEMDDFIVDDEDNMEPCCKNVDVSRHIKDIFGYDRDRYENFDDGDIRMEASFKDIMNEEVKSARLAKQEDLHELKMEMEHRKNKEKLKKSS